MPTDCGGSCRWCVMAALVGDWKGVGGGGWGVKEGGLPCNPNYDRDVPD